VVEDNEDILNLVTRILEANNFNVRGFHEPEAALEHVKGGCKEGIVILSDVQMPVIGGPKLVEKIKQIRPEMKVMMMSSYSLNKADFGQLMPSTIADDFIQKPFDMQELVTKISSLCS
jgi:DNA-binding NtrC family response regulator